MHAGQCGIQQDLRASLVVASCTPAHGVLIICAGCPVVLRSAADPRRVPSKNTVSDETEPTSAAGIVHNFLGQPWAVYHAACVRDPNIEAEVANVFMSAVMVALILLVFAVFDKVRFR